jgi:hypothetical protein
MLPTLESVANGIRRLFPAVIGSFDDSKEHLPILIDSPTRSNELAGCHRKRARMGPVGSPIEGSSKRQIRYEDNVVARNSIVELL